MLVEMNDVLFWLDLFLPQTEKLLSNEDSYPFLIMPECLKALHDFMSKELFYLAKETLNEVYTDEICGDNVYMRLCVEE